MSALGAFLRGAGGPGLTDLVNYSRRQDEIDQQNAERDRRLAEERAYREEKDAADRELKMQLLQERMTGTPSRSGSSGSSGGSASGGDGREMAVGALMAERGMSRAQAERDYEVSASGGENPYRRSVQKTEQIDDGDRMRNVTTTADELDPDAWAKVNKTIGLALRRAGGSPEQRAKADQIDWQTGSGRQAQDTPAQAGVLGQGVAVSEGKPLFNEGDSLYTGAVGAKTKAETAASGALAAQRSAESPKTRAETEKIRAEVGGNLKSQSPEKLTTTLNAINGLIRTYDENSMDDGARAARSELQGMAREIANELRTRGMSGDKAPAAGKPKYPEGTKLRGPDGKMYVVRGGKPVLDQ
jgi:hypothetical protein